MARLGVVGIIRTRLGSLGPAEMSPGSFEFACVYSCAPRSRRVHSGSLGLTEAPLLIAGSLGFSLARQVVTVFIRAGSLWFTWMCVVVAGLFRAFLRYHSAAPRGCRVHSGSLCSLLRA